MQTVSTIGLDIAKSVFQIHGVDASGVVVIRRQLKRRVAPLGNIVFRPGRSAAAGVSRRRHWGNACPRHLPLGCGRRLETANSC